MAINKKKTKKVKLDVYNENVNVSQELKYLKRRGGGGGLIGRTMDDMEVVEMGTEQINPSDDEELSDDEQDIDDGDITIKKPLNLMEDENMTDLDENDYIDLSDLLAEKSAFIPLNNTTKSAKSAIIDEQGFSSEGSSDQEEMDQSTLNSILKVGNEKGGKRKRMNERTEPMQETEFKATSGSKKVNLGDLVGAIGDEKNFANLKTHLSILEKNESVTVPLAPRLQAQVDRIPARIETEKSVSKFTPLVRKERESDSLRFNDSNPLKFNLSSNALVGKYQPFTEMEVEMNELLEKSGLTEKKQKEYEELELNKLSKEELIEKRAELSKMRSLMFYNEKKQRKIAKIKSKVYRKITKKSLEKNSENLTLEELEKISPEQAKEERDRLEFERAKERMTLKHKNTGKWARQMLGRSDNSQVD